MATQLKSNEEQKTLTMIANVSTIIGPVSLDLLESGFHIGRPANSYDHRPIPKIADSISAIIGVLDQLFCLSVSIYQSDLFLYLFNVLSFKVTSTF